jgi:hypothetical protein
MYYCQKRDDPNIRIIDPPININILGCTDYPPLVCIFLLGALLLFGPPIANCQHRWLLRHWLIKKVFFDWWDSRLLEVEKTTLVFAGNYTAALLDKIQIGRQIILFYSTCGNWSEGR